MAGGIHVPASSEGWSVTPTDGASPESAEHARKLQDILNRMEARMILGDVLFTFVLSTIILGLTFALWKRSRAGLGWYDGFIIAEIGLCVYLRHMAGAIGFTAAYLAWSTLVDRPHRQLPDYQTFVEGLPPAGEAADASEPAAPSPEAATLDRFEAKLGLPPKKPETDCVVCWSSEESPLTMPCAHVVCKGCLSRLKSATRNSCPFCRRPLFSLFNEQTLLFEALVAASGAQITLGLVLTGLQIFKMRYLNAPFELVVTCGLALAALREQLRAYEQGGEGYIASIAASDSATWVLRVQVAGSLYAVYRTLTGDLGIWRLDWVTFLDGAMNRYPPRDQVGFAKAICALAPQFFGC